MKHILKLPALLLASLLPAAADTQTENIPAGTSSTPWRELIGAHVINSAHMTPKVLTTTSGTTINCHFLPWTNLASGKYYTVEHPSDGTWRQVAGWNNGSRRLTVAGSVPASWTANTTLIVRRVKTINDLFGGPNLPLIQRGPATIADLIHVPNGSGTGFKTYYLRDIFPLRWRLVQGGNVYRGNDPVWFIQGMIFERRGLTPITLTFTGDPITTKKVLDLPHKLTSVGTGPRDHCISSLFGEVNPTQILPNIIGNTFPTGGGFTVGDQLWMYDFNGISSVFEWEGTSWVDLNTFEDVTNVLWMSSGFWAELPSGGSRTITLTP